MAEFDIVVVVGTGAAGVTAARRLLEGGLRVALVDGGQSGAADVPAQPYSEQRAERADQWRWMVGAPGTGAVSGLSSPKLRAATLAPVFSGFAEEVGVSTTKFEAIGSIAPGGLTAAWGAGVAAFDDEDLAEFPLRLRDLEPHYRRITARIGISGPASDDLDQHYGMVAGSMPPIALDKAGTLLGKRYVRRRAALHRAGFTLGRARLAVATEDRGERQACSTLGLCLWGCPRQSIYSAVQDLASVVREPGCTHIGGLLVERLRRDGQEWTVLARDRTTGAERTLTARRVILAAGVISTTKIAFQTLHRIDEPVRLLSTPTSAFMIMQPRVLASRPVPATALAQHWFTLGFDDRARDVCGGLFSIESLPFSELLPHVPLGLRAGIDLLAAIHPALSAGNLFFHSKWSDNRLTVTGAGGVHIEGGFAAGFPPLLSDVASRLRRSFRTLRAWILPGSFAVGIPGSDAHYAGTLPMRRQPGAGETSADGELVGARGVYIADGSCLTDLPPKSPTWTIMANADRIATKILAASPP